MQIQESRPIRTGRGRTYFKKRFGTLSGSQPIGQVRRISHHTTCVERVRVYVSRQAASLSIHGSPFPHVPALSLSVPHLDRQSISQWRAFLTVGVFNCGPDIRNSHLRLIPDLFAVPSCKELQVHHAEMSLRRSENEDIELSQLERREGSKSLVPLNQSKERVAAL